MSAALLAITQLGHLCNMVGMYVLTHLQHCTLLAGVDADQVQDDDLDDYATNQRSRVVRSRQAVTVEQASRITQKVLKSVKSSLQTLLTAEDLNLGALEIARQHLAGKDEERELQVRQLDVCLSELVLSPSVALCATCVFMLHT